jgi:hypothetical protein
LPGLVALVTNSADLTIMNPPWWPSSGSWEQWQLWQYSSKPFGGATGIAVKRAKVSELSSFFD